MHRPVAGLGAWCGWIPQIALPRYQRAVRLELQRCPHGIADGQPEECPDGSVEADLSVTEPAAFDGRFHRHGGVEGEPGVTG